MKSPMSRVEFVVLMAMMIATVAFSIDAMLPALPEIGRELSPDNLNNAQLILTAFMIGMGVGTFFTGPLSDTFGRKPVLVAGVALYMAAAVLAYMAPTLEMMLLARALQGLGAAGPRIVVMAIVRDQYEGREMARLMSFVMMVFSLVPAIAPALGAVVIDAAGWRSIFLAFVLFTFANTVWLMIRQPETLPRSERRPFQVAPMGIALKEIFSNPMVCLAIAVMTFNFAALFAMLSSVQQVFDITFGRGDSFPLWFGGVAIVAASASVINAVLVVRIGMRRMITFAMAAQLVICLLVILLEMSGLPNAVRFGLFVFWQTSIFFMVGLTLGNLNAMAMEPLGHIAGLAASMMAGISTVLAMVFAIPIGLAFDGTPMPLAFGVLVLISSGLALMLWLKRIEARQLV